MRKYLISYATREFYKSQRALGQSALKFGIDECVRYTGDELRGTSFYKENEQVLSCRRGAGYWLWKPYILLDTLKRVSEGDLVMYADSGSTVISSLSPLIALCRANHGILLFTNNLRNSVWTKRDCFVFMGCDSEAYWTAKQVQAAFQVYIKNPDSMRFVADYLEYCRDPAVLTDIPNRCSQKNFPGFKDHRHDQSVLTNLAVKYRIRLYRNPSQYGDMHKMPAFRKWGDSLKYPFMYHDKPDESSLYGTIIDHHRNKRLRVRSFEKVYDFLPAGIKRFYCNVSKSSEVKGVKHGERSL